MTAATLTYVIPVYNQEGVLRERMGRLLEQLEPRPGCEIVMVENGSSDDSAQLTRTLVREYSGSVRFSAVSSSTGLGAAFRRGIGLAGADYIVLTAADLPFGFSDVEAWQRRRPPPRIAIGSKGHPDSRIDVDPLRRLMSTGFSWLRRALLGLRGRDTQGTIIIERALALRILPLLQCDDYLVSTEIVAWAARMGVQAVELPVDYPRHGGRSTVSPVRDSLRMALGLWRLRGRLRQSANVAHDERHQ
jgi:glycosyltransferase involved in cell wall biosynthesis